jgi:small conductance mechanosensitive channel
MEESVNVVVTQATALITEYGFSVIGALVLLLVGLLAARWVSHGIGRALSRTKRIDETLRPFLVSLVRYVILAVTVLAVLAQFGVQTASLLAIFGAAGLAVGLALQGTLSNVAAGVMLLIFCPFKVGDFIEVGGLSGTVKEVGLFVTELATADNVQIIAPNSQLWGTAVRNYSHHTQRRLDLAFGIAYDAEIGTARQAILGVIKEDKRCLAEPEPLIAVAELADSSINFTVRVWCAAGDYWALKWALNEGIKQRLDQAGVEIPFPQRTVRIINEVAAAS